jgi:hypothetical protein
MKHRKPPVKRQALHKIHNRMQELGMVFARSQDEAIKLACEECKIAPFEKRRIIVRQDD